MKSRSAWIGNAIGSHRWLIAGAVVLLIVPIAILGYILSGSSPENVDGLSQPAERHPVKTPQHDVAAALEEVRQAVEQNNREALLQRIDPASTVLRNQVQSNLAYLTVTQARVNDLKINVAPSGTSAFVTFVGLIRYHAGDTAPPNDVELQFSAELSKQNRWVVSSVRYAPASSTTAFDTAVAKNQCDAFFVPVNLYSLHLREYPPTLQALLEPPTDKSEAKWKGPYLLTAAIPRDPWGHEYKYRVPGKHNPASFDVWSSGPDGVDETKDDIGNW